MWPSDVIKCRWTCSTLVQVMVSRRFGAKPLPEATLTHCQLYPWEQTCARGTDRGLSRGHCVFMHRLYFPIASWWCFHNLVVIDHCCKGSLGTVIDHCCKGSLFPGGLFPYSMLSSARCCYHFIRTTCQIKAFINVCLLSKAIGTWQLCKRV